MEEVFELRAHHLLCAVCAAAGAARPPCGTAVTDSIRAAIRSDPFLQIKLVADLDLVRAHYLDVFPGNSGPLPVDFLSRQADYADRAKDLELLYRLDIRPNTVHPAIDVVRLLFLRLESLEGICYHKSPTTNAWQECEHAREDYFRQTREKGGQRSYSLGNCWELGEELAGCGPYSLLPIRTKKEMRRAKQESSERIRNADRLFIRPHHLLCLLCYAGSADISKPLNEDNLQEIIVRMREEPEIAVTLTEGCCMVCDPCPAYDPDEHICTWIFTRDQLKDLRVLRELGLKPGDTLKARELLELVKNRIPAASQICGPDVFVEGSYVWAVCPSCGSGGYEKALASGIL